MFMLDLMSVLNDSSVFQGIRRAQVRSQHGSYCFLINKDLEHFPLDLCMLEIHSFVVEQYNECRAELQVDSLGIVSVSGSNSGIGIIMYLTH